MKHKKIISPSAILKIEAFWRWFNKNRIEIENAIQYFKNADNVLMSLNKKITQISRYVNFVLKGPKKDEKQFFTFIFTVNGKLKKVRWAYAFENCAPSIPNWKIQALMEPCEDLEVIKSGNDKQFIYHDFELKISDMYFDLLDYDIHKKTISIMVYLQNYTYHYDDEFLEEAVHIALEELLGELALKKHIAKVQLAQIPNENHDLIPLYELQQYLHLLYNSNRKLKI